jgi:hypothetical protein
VPALTARIRRRHAKIALSAVRARRGTEGSNPFPSSGESANHRFLSGGHSPIKPVFEEAPAHRNGGVQDSLEEPERRPKPEGPTSATDQRPNRSLNHFVGAGEGRWRDCDAERLGSVEVHHELEGRRLLDWQIGGLCAVEDLAGVTADLTPCSGEARSIAALLPQPAAQPSPTRRLEPDPVAELSPGTAAALGSRRSE